MIPLVQHPAEHIQQFMAAPSGEETVFSFVCPLFGEAFTDEAFTDEKQGLEYSARLFLQQGLWQLSILEGRLAEPSLLMEAESIAVQEPWFLSTVNIPKPWGEEIWFSAYEQRGVCCFSSAPAQRGIPIPIMLHLFPQLLANSQALNLLKILAPYSSELLGELYFEMHQEKQEVYVVSHVDPVAWPSGVAKMRFGFAKDKLNEFASFSAFKEAYLEAVNAYKKVRQEIDELLTVNAQNNRGDLCAETLKQKQLSALDENLQRRELDLSREMTSFIGHRAVRLGDVITVPKLLPHGLLHGVRVVEFQTPVYERLILSFRQKVLTQENWDTEYALSLLDRMPAVGADGDQHLDATHAEPSMRLSDELSSRLHMERIVAFDDFEVYRLQFVIDGAVSIPSLLDALLPTGDASGNLLLLSLHSLVVKSQHAEYSLQAEQGMCIPLLGSDAPPTLTLTAKKGAVMLISRSVC